MLLGVALAPGLARGAAPVTVALPEGMVARPFVATATQLYFRLGSSAHQAGESLERLWQTAGTADSTHPVWDEDGEELIAPRVIATYQDDVYFAAVRAGGEAALFRTDGGVAQRVADAPAQRGFASAGRLFFTTPRPSVGVDLWLADDLGANQTGVVLPDDTQAIAFGSRLLYAGAGPDGVEPWQTNGLLASPLADVAPGAAHSAPRDFALVGESVTFFSADADTDTLWRTDGTAAGTVAVKAWPSQPAAGSYERGAVGFARRLYFRGHAHGDTWALWSSDGTAAGTIALAALDALGAPMVGAGTSWFFVARHGGGTALYATDGTPAHTVPLVPRVVDSSGAGRGIDVLTALGDRVYYPLDDTHLGGSNGTALGTSSLELPADLGHVEGAAGIFAVSGQSLYFTTVAAGATRLWVLPLPAPQTAALDAGAAVAIAAAPAPAAEDEGCSCKDKAGFFSPFLGLFLFAFSKRRR